MIRFTAVDSPCGKFFAVSDGNALLRIFFEKDFSPEENFVEDPRGNACAVLRETRRQLEEYFAGTRREFDLPLAPAGTPFQRGVRAALMKIPYGETRTYGEIAAALGSPKAARAVGAANHANPFPPIVPCHRVVGAGGRLVGYAGGLGAKRALLEMERRFSRCRPPRGDVSSADYGLSL